MIIDKVISRLNYTDIMSVCTRNLLWSVSSFVFFNFLEKAINPGDCGWLVARMLVLFSKLKRSNNCIKYARDG